MHIGNKAILEHRPPFIKNTFLRKLFPRDKDTLAPQPEQPMLHLAAKRRGSRFWGATRTMQSHAEGGAADARADTHDRTRDRTRDRTHADVHADVRADAQAQERAAGQTAVRHAAGHALLRVPHLRAAILRDLPAQSQAAFMEAITDSSLMRELGPSPRTDTLRELPQRWRHGFLQNPELARAAVREALDHPDPVEAGRSAAALVAWLRDGALQMQALGCVDRTLLRLRHDRSRLSERALILQHATELLCSPFAEQEAAARALTLVGEHLAQLDRRYLLRTLCNVCTVASFGDAGIRMRALGQLGRHVDALGPEQRALLLVAAARFLAYVPLLGMREEEDAVQARAIRFLETQAARIPDPALRARPLIAMGCLPGMSGRSIAAFGRMLDEVEPHLSAWDAGEIAEGIAQNFGKWFGHGNAQPALGLGWLERLHLRTTPAHKASLAASMAAFLEDRFEARLTRDERARALAMVRADLVHTTGHGRAQALLALAHTLQNGVNGTPQLAQDVLATLSSEMMVGLDGAGRPRQGDDAAVAAVARALPCLRAHDRAVAFDLIETWLARAGAAQRIAPLAALADDGLDMAFTHVRTRELLEQHLPQVVQLPEAAALFLQLVVSPHLPLFPAELQRHAVHAAGHALAQRQGAELEAGLRALMPLFTRPADTAAVHAGFVLFGTHMADLSPDAREGLLHALQQQVQDMDLARARLAIGVMASNGDGAEVRRTLQQMIMALFVTEVSLASRLELAQTMHEGLVLLRDAGRGAALASLGRDFLDCLGNPRLHPQLSQELMSMFKFCVPFCRTEPGAWEQLSLSLERVPSTSVHFNEVQTIMRRGGRVRRFSFR